MNRLPLMFALLFAGCSNGSDVANDGASTTDDATTTDDAPPAIDAPIDAPPIDGLPPGPSSMRHTARPKGTTAAANGYYEYLPPGYGDGTLKPLLVFWHGIDENGNGTTELDEVLRNGPPKLIEANQWPDDRPFVVLSPQNTGGGCPSPSTIQAFIAYAAANYQVDPTRLYLTGLSCGAIGSWDYLREHLDSQIAAMVAICGNGTSAWNQRGCDLGKVPIWAFHGDSDPTVNVSGSTTPMNGLANCPSPPRKDAKLTIYPNVGHDSWTRTYNLQAGHDIYAWLLQQHK